MLCKGNPRKAKVIKFIRQSMLPASENKENTILYQDTLHEAPPECSGQAKPNPQSSEAAKPKDVRPTPLTHPHTPASTRARGKTPNFARIHQSAFKQMESIDSYVERKRARAALHGATPSARPASAVSKSWIPQMKKVPVGMPSTGKAEMVHPGAGRPRRVSLKKAVKNHPKKKETAEVRRQRNRIILGQVRSNRRVDLLFAKRGINI